MAFDPANLSQWSVNPIVGSQLPVGVPAEWGYYTATDTLATVTTAGYFNSGRRYLGSHSNNFNFLKKNDLLWCICSDTSSWVTVTSITPSITTQATDGTIPAGSITNAMIAANAGIAYSKLAALPSADILVGSAGNVATAVAMSGDVAITNAGATTIQAGAVTGAKIAANTITFANIAGNTIAAPELALSVPQTIAVPITSANFKTAYTAGLAMIPAGGAGTIINIIDVYYTFGFLTAAYTAGGAIQLQYSTAAPVNAGGIAASGTVAAADVTGLAATGYERVAGLLAINGAAGLVNAGVWFTVATQNFATGSGAVNVNITYNILNV